MMSFKQWSALLCLHISYLFLGATIFYHIENPLETAQLLESRKERIEILKLIHKNYAPSDHQAQKDIQEKIATYCDKIMTNISESEEPVPVWDFYHSFFFSYTVVSTIGYGNLAPTTSFGRILMIFYGLVGIPINAILFANLGAYFSTTFKRLYARYKERNPSSGANIDYQVSRLGLVGQIVLYLFPGIVIFIFFPATLFVIFEGWDYALAVYYAFVTLTTIGFGDYVAGIEDHGYGTYFIMYKIFLIFWITFGLGYLVMVVGFLTQGLKSKKVKRLERMVAQNLKQTQSKIWNNVLKDVNYLRKMLNEVSLLRYKPVYHDEVPTPKLHRSSSCPSFSLEREETPTVKRRRANSEALQVYKPTLKRVQSDTDLLAIDKNKTFGISGLVQPAELLARVVDALGTIQNNDNVIDEEEEEEGVHGFSDEEILASEKTKSNWSIGSTAVPPKTPRGRAASEIRFPNMDRDRFYNNNEWTWNSPGTPNRMKDIIGARRLGKLSVPNTSSSLKSGIDMVEMAPKKSLMSKLNPFKRRTSTDVDGQLNRSVEDGMSPTEYLKKTARGRISLAPNVERNLSTRPSRGRRGSIAVTNEHEEFLENTTVGDLLRALTVLSSSSSTDNPKRKLGTASLTPPQMASTLNLFPPSPRNFDRRRFSVHPVTLSSLTEDRRPSQPNALPPAAARRRFSLHPSSGNTDSITPSMSPVMTNQPRRGSLLLPPPYTPYSSADAPGSNPMTRRRLPSTGSRVSSLWGTPNMRNRRPLFPPSIIEGQTRRESLEDVRVDEANSEESKES